MAYSPIEQARLLRNPKLTDFAHRYDLTPAQVALAWLLAQDNVMVIPKTRRRERLKENYKAIDRPLPPPNLPSLIDCSHRRQARVHWRCSR